MSMPSAYQTTPQTPAPQAAPQQGRAGSQPGGFSPGGPSRGGGSGAFRGWEWWKDDEVKRELGLTDKVATDIDNFYRNRLRQMAPFVEAYNREREALDQMTRERGVDEPTYSVQVSRVVSLQVRLLESRTVMLYHIYLKLTPEQHKKLQDVLDRRFQRGRGGPAAR